MPYSSSPPPPLRIRWRRGRVTATGRRGRDSLELTVEVPDEGQLKALAYPSLVGIPQVGDDVLLNTTALAQGLGTGGVALVIAVPDRLPPDPTGPGHLVKARYTPLQVTVAGRRRAGHRAPRADGRGRRHRRHAGGRGRPALGAAGGADRDAGDRPRPQGRVRDDGRRGAARGLLPDAGHAGRRRWPASSPSARRSAATWRRSPCTPGCSRRGTCSAPTSRSSRRGPGNLGTGTPWGFSGVAAGEACNAVTVLGGQAIGALRISDADPRPRHRGVSHHSLTAFGRVALGGVTLVAPRGLSSELGGQVDEDLAGQPRRATRSSGSTPTAWTRPWASPPCRCGRWAAATPRSAPTSWRLRPPAGTPRSPCRRPRRPSLPRTNPLRRPRADS